MGTTRARKPPRGAPKTRTFNGKTYRWDGTWTEDRIAAHATAATRRDIGKKARIMKTRREGITDYHLYVRGRATKRVAAKPKKKAKPKRRRTLLEQLFG